MITVERKARIEVLTKTIFIDVVFKASGLIHLTPFTFTPGKVIECLSSYNEPKSGQKFGEWIDTWVYWKGPKKGYLIDPSNIIIHCRDKDKFYWESPLKEFLNPKLFTTKEYL